MSKTENTEKMDITVLILTSAKKLDLKKCSEVIFVHRTRFAFVIVHCERPGSNYDQILVARLHSTQNN